VGVDRIVCVCVCAVFVVVVFVCIVCHRPVSCVLNVVSPFLCCTSVFFTGAWVQHFVLIKISYLECMCNFRAPWHVLLLFY